MSYRARASIYDIGQVSQNSSLWSFIASPPLTSRLFLLFTLIAVPLNFAFASEFELSRIANELNLASGALAKERGYSQGFTGISHRASSLARESLQLIDAIQRNRNPSNIRSQFNDVSRRYTDLEDTFWRGHRNYPDKIVFQKLEVISKIYSDLFTAYTLTRYYQGTPQIHIFVNPNTGNNGLPIAPTFSIP